MLQYLRVRERAEKAAPDPADLSIASLSADSDLPITIRSLNGLPENVKRRVYRVLIPHHLLSRFDVDPITWQGPDKNQYVELAAEPGTGHVRLSARSPFDPGDPFVVVELADNSHSSVDLNLIVLNDPASPRYGTDRDPAGSPTLFGTLRRNLAEEARALADGLAPGQVRAGLGCSKEVLQQVETFLMALGHRAFYLEPLSYASAWVFERRGLAYVRGHQLMGQIDAEFQPGGRLHAALDGSTPFRQPDAWQTVRGRAWAIHDGALEAIGQQWDKLRMVKQLGREAGVSTFPGAVY